MLLFWQARKYLLIFKLKQQKSANIGSEAKKTYEHISSKIQPELFYCFSMTTQLPELNVFFCFFLSNMFFFLLSFISSINLQYFSLGGWIKIHKIDHIHSSFNEKTKPNKNRFEEVKDGFCIAIWYMVKLSYHIWRFLQIYTSFFQFQSIFHCLRKLIKQKLLRDIRTIYFKIIKV